MSDPRRLLDRLLLGTAPGESPLTHVETLPARAGSSVPWPEWVPETLVARLAARGVAAPWRHQEQAASAAHAGRSVVVATGTASGKSLAYQLPGLTSLLADERARVLYLSPTKALAGDQLRALEEFALPQLRAATFDGDTPYDERDWVRAHANWVLTNPDMLHRGMLPGHARWAPFFRRLRYVVIDECHAYRGLFGSHVAQVLRRLRRVCASYGSAPVFVLASATTADPAGVGVAAGGVAGRGGDRRYLAARFDGVRAVGAAADRAAGRARRAGAPFGRGRGRPAAGRSGRRAGPHPGLRAFAPRGGADRDGRAAGTSPRPRRPSWCRAWRRTARATCPRSGGRWRRR